MMRRHVACRRRDERGAVAVLVVVLSTALLMIAALVVDIGMQRVGRADMQALADVVALDLAQQIDDRTVGQLEPIEQSLANASRDRNKSVIDYKDHPPALDVAWGKLDADRKFQVITDSATVPTAVRVRAKTEVGFAFSGITQVATGGANRAAVATQSDPSVCVSVGTKTLTLDTSGSVLAPLLEDSLGGLLDVDLDVIGYNGIVDLKNVYIPLADLLVALNIGSSDALVGSDVTLQQLAVAMADVASRNGDAASAKVLNEIGLKAKDVTVHLGQILALESGQDAAGLNAGINALDLLGVVATAANGQHALEANLPGYLSVTAIEPPQIACGKGNGKVTAKSAQIKLAVDIPNLLQAADSLGIAKPSLLVSGKAKLEVNVGYATARIDEIECGPGRVRLQVDTGATGVATKDPHIEIGITATSFLSEALPLLDVVTKTLLKALIGSEPVGLRVQAGATVASSSKNTWISYPAAPAVLGPIRFPEPDSVRKTLNLNAVGVTLTGGGIVGLLGALLNPVVGAVTSGIVAPLLNSTLSPLLDALVHPVLEALGIGLGVADVRMGDRPVCNGIKLVG